MIWRLSVSTSAAGSSTTAAYDGAGARHASATTARSTGQHGPVPLAGGRHVQVGPHLVGAGCTLGDGAFVHYGVTIGDGAVLAPDSFLMKGEEIPPYEHWGGNPAGEMRVPAAFMVRQDHDESRSIALAGTY